ncbi:hypothetical protein VP01_44g12 [Puccinia sorghi]|uniref:Transmembrane protein 14C n=1 Tax=Puccinia sorghi TaxID=27349 RepID=A0A0L6UP55_9BASI|nr:hypothetical protein VP01_44g12 [Puccinia sorghi]
MPLGLRREGLSMNSGRVLHATVRIKSEQNIPSTMHNTPDYLGYAYGFLVATGGIMGFVKASSVPSLVAGTVSGGLIALGAHRYQQKGKPDLIFGMSVMLTLLMGKRFLASRKMMPAGMTTVKFAVDYLD